MTKPFRIVIVGAGPAGLSAALAITRQQQQQPCTRPVHITVLELRRTIRTIGGAVNLTPLALRYLDALGAGSLLRPRGNPASAIELVAHRTGRLLATLWPGVDALRVRREAVVEALSEAARRMMDAGGPNVLEIVYGARVSSIVQEEEEEGGEGSSSSSSSSSSSAVRVTYTLAADDGSGGGGDGGSDMDKVIDADLVLGCDGIHSAVRRLLVEPDRPETYTGKCVAYGFIPATPEEAAGARWTRADGRPLVRDTTLVQVGSESLLLAFYEPPGPNRRGLYLAAVMPVPDAGAGAGGREGWAVRGADKKGLREKVAGMFAGGRIACLEEIVARCDDWFFYPVYMLPDGGVWAKGRVLLLGDAAHAMPPQGESTGVAIEDGVLLAHVLSRRDTRSIPQMLDDYKALRHADVSALYKTSMARWNSMAVGWLGGIFMEWMSWIVVSYLNWTSNHFARDVRNFPLPE